MTTQPSLPARQEPLLIVGGKPFPLARPDGEVAGALMIESARLQQGKLDITGWVIGNAELAASADGRRLSSVTSRFSRADVAKRIGIPELYPGYGFDLSADGVNSSVLRVHVTLRNSAGEVTLIGDYRLDGIVRDRALTDSFVAPPFWIEKAAANAAIGEGVLVGWSVFPPDLRLMLRGNDFTLDLPGIEERFFRADVWSQHGRTFGAGAANAGFILRIPGVFPGDTLSLIAQADGDEHELKRIVFEALPDDPRGAAEVIFGARSPDNELPKRIRQVDGPILSRLLAREVARWDSLPVRVRHLGPALENPRVTLVIPLWGRIDFVEHQITEFVRDPWLPANTQIVFVLDDPALVDAFASEAVDLHRLYGLAFSWVWGGVNRGFAGANNLGAQHARGEHLVFLNSDVFPRGPGWVQPLLEVLDRNPDIGVVGPRLLFADGSIQHASMRFERREEFGVWINQHPYMGLDPSLDPARSLIEVPAVTGACLVMRKQDFDAVGGWDTGYLIGDFEDSDLCMKVRASGKKVGYLPTIELTHLERQSMKLLGSDFFRQRTTILNAVRHEDRWVQYMHGVTPLGQ